MRESERGFIAIENVDTPRVRFTTVLPEYIDREHLGVHIEDIERMCLLGGINHLRVVGETEGQVSSFTPLVAGFDSQGNAYSAAGGLKKSVPTHTVESRDTMGRSEPSYFLGFPHACRWVDATIRINMDEIGNRIVADKKRGGDLRSTKAWAHHLNNSLKQGVSRTGVRHLTTGLSKENAGMATLLALHVLLVSAKAHPIINPLYQDWGPQIPSAARVLTALLSIYLMANSIDFFQSRTRDRKDHRNYYRWSLLYGPQIDRALFLKIWSIRKTLVKSLED